ncbi:Gfo/Idh/MocA family protein [Jeotgalibacillus sp. S-D1]|uniref:Gfo/Idh/MocA family protein n=1 Tax=Jeotgalibacillus sp. S-D1 TaxID=2552189 RepID=UPI001F100A66|nr:Gfo/Idh/MocA family oxidoreductase [Jeotgalibacillus sp. S-D1]
MINIGLIGTGSISNLHVKQLLDTNAATLIAVTDPNPDNRDTLINRFNLRGVAQFSDHKEMLAQVSLDAVIICSPHTLHFDQVMDAISHNCHVLIEKPMACSLAEAEQLIEAAEKAEIVLQVSYQRHFEPAFLAIRDAISNGAIGKLTSVTASVYQEWIQLSADTWRQNPNLSGGGMLMDSGSHIIDVLLWTTGLKPIEVESKLEQRGSKVEIDSVTTIRFENDVIAGLTIIGNAPCWHETYVFCGDDGAIFYDNGDITIRKLGQPPIKPVLSHQTTNSDKSFINSIQGHHDVLVPGEFAKEVVRLTEWIYQSGEYEVNVVR